MIANICSVNADYDLTILKRMYLEQVHELREVPAPWLATLTTGTTRQPVPADVAESHYGPTYFLHAYCARS